MAFPPAIGGFDYKACFDQLPNTGVVDREGFYRNSYVASGQASNMTMGSRLDNYFCLVGSPNHYGNVSFVVNVFTMYGEALGEQINAYEVSMQTLLPKFIIDGPTIGRVGEPFSTDVPIYSDPSSDLGWTATVAAGHLPPGLAVTGNGNITGTPRRSGMYSFTLEYTTPVVPWQNEARPRHAITLVVARPLAVVPSRLRSATVGRPYAARLTGRGGWPPYRFTVPTRSRLPRGLRVSQTGTVSGTPLNAGTYRLAVEIVDSTGARRRTSVLLRIARRR
jgi:Putative Ig domain